jgi:DNA repair protein RadD
LLQKSVLQWLTDPDQKHVKFVGLSATPWTRGLGTYYDSLIIAATTRELIEAGRLSPFRVFAPSEPDLAGVRTVGGDFHAGELAERCDTTKLVGDVVAEWLKRGENRQTLAYGVNCKHAQHIQQRFLEASITCAYVDAFTDGPDRERIFDTYRRGEI